MCSDCGAAIKPGDRFCLNCGANLAKGKRAQKIEEGPQEILFAPKPPPAPERPGRAAVESKPVVLPNPSAPKQNPAAVKQNPAVVVAPKLAPEKKRPPQQPGAKKLEAAQAGRKKQEKRKREAVGGKSTDFIGILEALGYCIAFPLAVKLAFFSGVDGGGANELTLQVLFLALALAGIGTVRRIFGFFGLGAS